MDVEIIHMYDGILLSYKKKNTFESVFMRWMSQKPIVQSEVSQKEKEILYINTCVWNLERWYWWTYLQSSSGGADIENRLVNTVGEGEGGMTWESGMETCASPFVR